MDANSRNEVELEGIADAAPEFSHENHGIRFFQFLLRVPRLSGQADTLPVLIPEQQLPQVTPGTPLRITGQLRSFNNRSGSGSRLVLSVYAQSVSPGTGEFFNRILLSGVLCRPPIFRRTPLGRSICDLMLAVSRRYGRADYLPVIAWGQLATVLSRAGVGQRVCLEGRIQSRIYIKTTPDGPVEHTAYEVSIMHLPEEEPVQSAQ
ncbi:MAG: single-stranded DNA-binding protein [Oscillibacter sp.]|jgi:single-stranded DNA-binding protein|nr:single-stranded DNA-binding protein [Oscillibacter sp.]